MCRRRDADQRAVVRLLVLVGLGCPRVGTPRASARRRGRGRCRGIPVPVAERVPQPRGGDHTRALRLHAIRGQAARSHPRQAHDPGPPPSSYLVLSHLLERDGKLAVDTQYIGEIVPATRGWECEGRSNRIMLFPFRMNYTVAVLLVTEML